MDPRVSRVSIIMPVYNTAAFLDATLQSVWEQTFTDYELIAIDDGSSDGSPDVLNAWTEKSWPSTGAMRVITQANQGAAAARNRGIAEASSPWLLFLDSDDLLDRDLLTELIKAVEGTPDAKLIFPLVRYIDEESKPLGIRSFCEEQRPGPDRLLARNPIHSGTGVLVDRAASQAVGGFDRELRASIDLDLWVRILITTGSRALCLPRHLVGYRKRRGQITGNWRRMRDARAQVFRKLDSLAPELASSVRAEAFARAQVFWSTIAYTQGEYSDSRSLICSAWKSKPLLMVRNREAVFRLLTAAVSLLPEPLHRTMRGAFNQRPRAG